MISPFKALRFNPKRVPDLRRVVAPMGEALPDDTRGMAEHSALHLMFPASTKTGVETFCNWLNDGTLQEDPLPGLYPYLQSFDALGGGRVTRIGFLALVHLGRATVYPHEAVLEPSIRARLPFLQASGLQAIPTHGLYEDAEFLLERMIAANLGYPLAEVVDAEAVRHTLGRFTDLRLIQRCRDVLRDKAIFLADGHHRLETFVRFRNEFLEQNPNTPDDHPAHFHLMYLSNFYAPDLRIRPFHRLVDLPSGLDASVALQRLTENFEIRLTAGRAPHLAELQAAPGTLGLVLGKQTYTLRLKPGLDVQAAIQLDVPAAVKKLGYTWVHFLAIDRAFGLPYATQPSDASIQYNMNAGVVAKAALLNHRKAAFIMPEVTPPEMMDVCTSGALMPQKSTYFYPKVQGGLVFSRITSN